MNTIFKRFVLQWTPKDPKFVAIVDKWLLFRDSFKLEKFKMVVVVDK